MTGDIDSVAAFRDALQQGALVERRVVGVDLPRATLNGAELTGSTFERCGFEGTSWRSVEAAGCRFTKCRFFDAEGESAADFSYARLREASFANCDLTTVEFNGARLYDLTLDNCQAQGADFNGADFRLPVGDTDLAAFRAADCNLAYADFSNTFLAGATLERCRLVHARFDYATLDDADLTGSDLANISGVGLRLRGADLRGATFNNLDPREIDLEKVTISLDQCALLLAPLGINIDTDF